MLLNSEGSTEHYILYIALIMQYDPTTIRSWMLNPLCFDCDRSNSVYFISYSQQDLSPVGIFFLPNVA